MTMTVPDFFSHTPATALAGPVVVRDCPPIPAARVGDGGAVEVQFRKGPEPHFVPARESATAHPASPVGRAAARLAADPDACSPLRRLEERIGRALVDLATLTDSELHALTDRILVEKHNRAARWLGITS